MKRLNLGRGWYREFNVVLPDRNDFLGWKSVEALQTFLHPDVELVYKLIFSANDYGLILVKSKDRNND